MKKIELITLCVLLAFPLNACSTLAQSPIITISPTQIYTPTPTFTPQSTATAASVPTATKAPTAEPTLAGINVLHPDDIGNDSMIIQIYAYEPGSSPSTSPVKRGDTYAELDVPYGPVIQHWLVTTAVFYKPGAGVSPTQMAADEPTDEFQVCNSDSDITQCKLGSMDQLRNYALWAQKKFGDNNHVVKLLVNYPLDDMGSKALKANIKIYESDLTFAIIATPKTGGASSWNDPIIEWALGQDPQLFANLQNFATSAEPSAFSNPFDIYEFVIPNE